MMKHDSQMGEAPRQYAWKVAVVEDHLLQRKRTEELVCAQSGLSVVWSGETLPEFMLWLESASPENRPQLLLLDLMVERGASAEPEQIQAVVDAGIQVLVISALASPGLLRRVIRVGVSGVVGKRDAESDIVAAMWTALGQGNWMSPELASVIAGDESRPALSEQEERALVLYASGLTMISVAEAMGIKPDTAKKYLNRVKLKYADAGRPLGNKIDMHEAARQDGLLGD